MSKGFTEGYKTYDTKNGFGSSSRWQSAFEERLNFKKLSKAEIEGNKSIVDCLYNAKSKVDLRGEYYQLMKRYHPDSAGDTEDNKTISQLINDTYHNLKSKF